MESIRCARVINTAAMLVCVFSRSEEGELSSYDDTLKELADDRGIAVVPVSQGGGSGAA